MTEDAPSVPEPPLVGYGMICGTPRCGNVVIVTRRGLPENETPEEYAARGSRWVLGARQHGWGFVVDEMQGTTLVEGAALVVRRLSPRCPECRGKHPDEGARGVTEDLVEGDCQLVLRCTQDRGTCTATTPFTAEAFHGAELDAEIARRNRLRTLLPRPFPRWGWGIRVLEEQFLVGAVCGYHLERNRRRSLKAVRLEAKRRRASHGQESAPVPA